MPGFLDVLSSLNPFKPAPAGPPVLSVDDLDPRAYFGNFQQTFFTGDKFTGGYGPTQGLIPDYWTLRMRSRQLFTDNLYARGLIRRLVTNEINTGLLPEVAPIESLIGLPDDSLSEWSQDTENRFLVWTKNPRVCDHKRKKTFGAKQRSIRREALIDGDVLIVTRQNPTTRRPSIQTIPGHLVQTPILSTPSRTRLREGHEIKQGVEVDPQERHVAFWVKQKNGKFERLPAFGPRTGRRIAWLYYGTDKREEEVRGMPLLSLILQSLREIDRYRDSAQRKATINSLLAMYIMKGRDKPGTKPWSGGALRKDTIQGTDSNGTPRSFTLQGQIPGLVMEELQEGEEPKGFKSDGTDEKFAEFEAAVVHALAWANEVPPEILTLAFSNNYSASQAAINEFKIYLNKFWGSFGEEVCDPIYQEWLISEALAMSIEAPGLLESWRDLRRYDVFGAWVYADWWGTIKPSTDIRKQAQGEQILVAEAWSTNARTSRQLTGTDFDRNVRILKRENEMKVEAARPIAEFRREFGEDIANDALGVNQGGGGSAVEETAEAVLSLIEDENPAATS